MTQLVPDRQTWGEIVRFILVGVKSNILYVIIYVSLTLLGVDYRIAVTVVFVFGLLYMFLFNKYYVFKKRDGENVPQFARHLLLYAGIWAVNIVTLQLLSFHFRIHPYIVQLLLVPIVVVVVFVFNKYFIFGSNRNIESRVSSPD